MISTTATRLGDPIYLRFRKLDSKAYKVITLANMVLKFEVSMKTVVILWAYKRNEVFRILNLLSKNICKI